MSSLACLFIAPHNFSSNELIGKTITEANQFLVDYGFKDCYEDHFYVCDKGDNNFKNNRIRVVTKNGKITKITGFQ